MMTDFFLTELNLLTPPLLFFPSSEKKTDQPIHWKERFFPESDSLVSDLNSLEGIISE